MPFVAMDHALVFAIDAAAKASDMQQLDQNVDYLKALFHIATGHKHGGGTDDGAPVAGVAANAIDQTAIAPSAVGSGELKTAPQSGTYQSGTPTNITLSGGEFHFLLSGGGTHANSVLQLEQPEMDNSLYAIGNTGGVVHRFRITSSSGYSASYVTRYVQSSPPYKMGGLKWNHFFFILRNKATGEVIGTCESPDPCWQNNGRLYLPKDHPDKIIAVPHPFASYVDNPAALVSEGLEVEMLDMRSINLDLWNKKNRKLGKHISEDLQAFLPTRGTKKTHASMGMAGLGGWANKVHIITP